MTIYVHLQCALPVGPYEGIEDCYKWQHRFSAAAGDFMSLRGEPEKNIFQRVIATVENSIVLHSIENSCRNKVRDILSYPSHDATLCGMTRVPCPDVYRGPTLEPGLGRWLNGERRAGPGRAFAHGALPGPARSSDMGLSSSIRGVIGRNGLHLSGVQLLDFCASSHSLSIMNTMFEHKGVHKCTWHQDALGRRPMIDFIIVSPDLQPYVLDTRVKRGAELSTDHHLVVGWIRWWGRMLGRPGGPKQIVRVCWECLAEEPVQMVFNSHLRQSFDCIPRVAGDMDGF
ncbi:hypothetical protein L3Q82_005074 [Scortum barcoo]|uniref:Uncharacterized protein n=1 Tax=Scortum barcoo TaxID=214431 RepID=A0ACB8VEC5_9TELE|nr:hypothetical protein L3Q82_005074 [Scortum barcoo]